MSDQSDHRSISRRAVLRRGARAAAALAVLPAVAGCTLLSATDDDRYVVFMSENRFSPTGLRIPVGATVVWRNMDLSPHTVTTRVDLLDDPARVSLPAGAPSWHSGDIVTGAQWTHTFWHPGTYVYACVHHQEAGMIGTITVVADGSATPVAETE